MRAISYQHYGEPTDVLAPAEVADLPAPGPGQVLIRVTKRPIHPGDLLGVRGRYRSPGDTADLAPGGATPGFEGVGIVEATHPDVDPSRALQPGRRVMFFPGRAAWSERVLVQAQFVTPVPDDLSDAVASQLHVVTLTAALLLRAADDVIAKAATPGCIVLTAAGSAVGRLATRLAVRRGLHVVNVVRSRAGAAVLREQVPDVAVVSTDEASWQRKLLSATASRPIQAVLDPVGGPVASELVALLAGGGTLISYGNLSGEPLVVPALWFSTRGISVRGVSVGGWSGLPERQRHDDIQLAIDLARNEPAQFVVEAEYPFEDIALAAAHAERPGKRGAVVLTST